MSSPINHRELAESRLATQFKESVNLISYIKALLLESDSLEEVFRNLLTDRWIDTAEGTNLDIIGSIVGQPRILVDALIINYFGFLPNSGASSFGSVSNVSLGGRFRSKEESTTGNRKLTDEEYRLYIRARIIKNSISPNLPETLSFFKFLFSVDQVVIVDGTMNYAVQIGRRLSPNEKAFLINTDLVPKVAGVGVSYQEYEADLAFGFSGIPTSKGFGSVNNSSLRGKFSYIIS